MVCCRFDQNNICHHFGYVAVILITWSHCWATCHCDGCIIMSKAQLREASSHRPFREDSRIMGGKGLWNFVSKYGHSKIKKFRPTQKVQISSYCHMANDHKHLFTNYRCYSSNSSSKRHDSHWICLLLKNFPQRHASIVFGIWNWHHVYITWLFSNL